MTISGAIKEIESFEIPFYQESSREKVIETIIDTYYQGVTDAIDEFADYIEAAFLYSNFSITDVRPMAEQLKEKKNE